MAHEYNSMVGFGAGPPSSNPSTAVFSLNSRTSELSSIKSQNQNENPDKAWRFLHYPGPVSNHPDAVGDLDFDMFPRLREIEEELLSISNIDSEGDVNASVKLSRLDSTDFILDDSTIKDNNLGVNGTYTSSENWSVSQDALTTNSGYGSTGWGSVSPTLSFINNSPSIVTAANQIGHDQVYNNSAEHVGIERSCGLFLADAGNKQGEKRKVRLSPNTSHKSMSSETEGDTALSAESNGEERNPDFPERGINETNSQVPQLGMVFSSEEEAYKFYVNYASQIGFRVRKAKVQRWPNGKIKKRHFYCSKEGHRSKRQSDKTTKYKRKETRTGCEARIQLTDNDGKWVVSNLIVEHNHDLAGSSSALNVEDVGADCAGDDDYKYLQNGKDKVVVDNCVQEQMGKHMKQLGLSASEIKQLVLEIVAKSIAVEECSKLVETCLEKAPKDEVDKQIKRLCSCASELKLKALDVMAKNVTMEACLQLVETYLDKAPKDVEAGDANERAMHKSPAVNNSDNIEIRKPSKKS